VRPTLAAYSASYHIQIMCTYASGAYRQQPIVFLWSRDGHSEHAIPEATEICRHQSLTAYHST